MKFRLESRQKIQADSRRHEQRIKECQPHLEHIVDDKRVIADYARAVQAAGTTEAAREIQRAIREMKGETDAQLEINTGDYLHAMEQVKKHEEQIALCTLQSRRDGLLAEQAAGQIRQTPGAKEALHQAQAASAKETSFLEQTVRSDREVKTRAQEVLTDLLANYNNIPIKYTVTNSVLPQTVDAKQYDHFVPRENYQRQRERIKQIEKMYLHDQAAYAARLDGHEGPTPQQLKHRKLYHEASEKNPPAYDHTIPGGQPPYVSNQGGKSS